MYPKLLGYLNLFSLDSLKGYLGRDLVDQLALEWDNDGNVITKRKLAEMIVHLNGVAILKVPAFRKDLLSHMPEAEIERVFQQVPENKRQGITTTKSKIDVISKLPWGESSTNVELLKVLGIETNIFSSVEEDDSTIMNHCAMNRFFELLDYQFIIKQRVLTELNSPMELKRMLVHMPTGTGKTKTTMHTLVHYYNFSLKQKGLIIWLAHTTELLQQAYDTFANVWVHLGSGTVKTYKLWGTRPIPSSDTVLEGIMFCGIQKLLSVKQSQPELFERIVQNVRLIIFDEAHKAAAKETRQLIESMMFKTPDMPDRSLLGLTATPGRTTLTSDENNVLADMFDQRSIGIDINVISQVNLSRIEYLNTVQDKNPIHYFQRTKILSRINKEQLTYAEQFSPEELQLIKTKASENGYVDFAKKSLELIGRNRSRNAAIMVKLRELFTQAVPTIVFACSASHAKLLSFMLSLEDIPNALVLGEMDSTDRERAIAAFKDRENPINILINYEVLTTGFDSTNIRCVFITRPTQSIVLYSQMLGRGLRGPMMGGNAECLLIDIKDNLGKYDADMAFNHFDAYWS